MAVKYAITNFLHSGCDFYSSSEHSIHTLENLYNVRPSKPFRTIGIGTTSGAIPEWFCVDLQQAKQPNFVAYFNINLILNQSGDFFELQACDEGCPPQNGACDWTSPDYKLNLLGTLVQDFKNIHKSFSPGAAYQYWRTAVIDSGNPDGYLEFGEWFLGILSGFTKAYLQPGRSDGPEFYEATSVTEYGQIWSRYHGEAENFKLEIINIDNPNQVNELRKFLKLVKRANGKFVIIPDDKLPFCFYVHLRNTADFGRLLQKGYYPPSEVYSWSLDLRTLTEGIALLG